MLKPRWVVVAGATVALCVGGTAGYLIGSHGAQKAEPTLGDLLRCADFIESLMSENRMEEAAAKVAECKAQGYLDDDWIREKGYPSL